MPQADMEFFDRLPAEIRQALRESHQNILARMFSDGISYLGWDVEKALAVVEECRDTQHDREVAVWQKHGLDRWGANDGN